MITSINKFRELAEQGVPFIVNHSAGKDSQAMTLLLRSIVPANQLIVVHAHLPGMEWPGVIEHIQSTTEGLAFHKVTAQYADGSQKTFQNMVKKRGMFPSPAQRWCTSDLKRAPIEKFIRAFARESGATTIVNCLGLRAGESRNRANADVVKYNTRLTTKSRTVIDWLPIHHYSTADVFNAIDEAGQKPHWAYAAGASRLSCALCIMASDKDLAIGAKHNPEVFKQVSRLERQVKHTLRQPTKRRPAPYLETIIPEVSMAFFAQHDLFEAEKK